MGDTNDYVMQRVKCGSCADPKDGLSDNSRTGSLRKVDIATEDEASSTEFVPATPTLENASDDDKIQRLRNEDDYFDYLASYAIDDEDTRTEEGSSGSRTKIDSFQSQNKSAVTENPDPTLQFSDEESSNSSECQSNSKPNPRPCKELLYNPTQHVIYESSTGRSLVHYGCLSNQTRLVRYLVQYRKMGLNLIDSQGLSPLHLSVRNGSLHLCELLLQSSADPNIQSGKLFDTPLHLVTNLRNPVGIASVLVNFQADVLKINRDGCTPLQVVQRSKTHPTQEDLLDILELETKRANLFDQGIKDRHHNNKTNSDPGLDFDVRILITSDLDDRLADGETILRKIIDNFLLETTSMLHTLKEWKKSFGWTHLFRALDSGS